VSGLWGLWPVVAAWSVLWWITPQRMTPDGTTYLRRAVGHAVAAPFRWRVWPVALRPWVTGEGGQATMPRALDVALDAARWLSVLWSALVLAHWAGLPAGLLWLGLPIARVQGSWRWTQDALGHAAALSCLVAPEWAWVPLAVLAGTTSERAPVFAALIVWSPLPLVGLAVPAVGYLLSERGPAADYERAIITRPLASARECARGGGVAAYLLPWGACLLALPVLGWQGWALTAVAYAQCLVAVDRARLYQWAAPAWCVAASLTIGGWEWWPVVVAVHWALPWRTATEGCER